MRDIVYFSAISASRAIFSSLRLKLNIFEGSVRQINLTAVITFIREVELLLSQTEDAFSMLARFGAPSFSGLANVNNPLHRAAAGGALNTIELLNIAGTLRSLRSLYEWYKTSDNVCCE